MLYGLDMQLEISVSSGKLNTIRENCLKSSESGKLIISRSIYFHCDSVSTILGVSYDPQDLNEIMEKFGFSLWFGIYLCVPFQSLFHG